MPHPLFYMCMRGTGLACKVLKNIVLCVFERCCFLHLKNIVFRLYKFSQVWYNKNQEKTSLFSWFGFFEPLVDGRPYNITADLKGSGYNGQKKINIHRHNADLRGVRRGFGARFRKPLGLRAP